MIHARETVACAHCHLQDYSLVAYNIVHLDAYTLLPHGGFTKTPRLPAPPRTRSAERSLYRHARRPSPRRRQTRARAQPRVRADTCYSACVCANWCQLMSTNAELLPHERQTPTHSRSPASNLASRFLFFMSSRLSHSASRPFSPPHLFHATTSTCMRRKSIMFE